MAELRNQTHLETLSTARAVVASSQAHTEPQARAVHHQARAVVASPQAVMSLRVLVMHPHLQNDDAWVTTASWRTAHDRRSWRLSATSRRTCSASRKCTRHSAHIRRQRRPKRLRGSKTSPATQFLTAVTTTATSRRMEMSEHVCDPQEMDL